jgi:ribosomal protein L7/L12
MQIKCTSCGAAQELAPNNQCGFCGSTVEAEKAQENYKSSTSGEVGNLMMMADTAIDATNWEEALQYFNKALEKDISNSDAWLGKGIAIVYTSKIGDIKTTEAIAYWKNAIKHAPNSEAMSKRVAKEINNVVNSFYPAIENHYIQFHDLDNSYQELVSRFATLESAQDYATQLDFTKIDYCETGYALCQRIIDLPKRYVSAASGSAIAEGLIGQFSSNEFSRKSAAKDASVKINKAKGRKNEINKAALIVADIEVKYLNLISNINPNHESLTSNKFGNKKLNDEIISLLKEGKKLSAVKLYEKSTGLSLKESKDIVEQLATVNGIELVKGIDSTNVKSGCFIATATMGDYDHPVVMDLRMFRDNWLLKRDWGVRFTNWYYTHGPKAAHIIEKSFFLRRLTFIFVVKPLQIITKNLK